MIRLIHIAPELPPTVGGVADYTDILSHRLVEVSDGDVDPVLLHTGWRSADAIRVDFPVFDLSGQCSATALAETVRRQADETDGRVVVLLEYSGYGYAKRGAPLWLARGLREACGDGAPPLITMFHELYATGPPWSSTFWVSPLQVIVVYRLVGLSSRMVTNRISSVSCLRSLSSVGTNVYAQPVFSNVAEPNNRRPFSQRKDQAVVFGGERQKNILYSDHGKAIQSRLRSLEVNRVIDVGPSPGKVALKDFSIPVHLAGVLPPAEVSRFLLESKIGVGHAPSDCITKSGVIAAYLAHGTLPLLVGGAEVLGLKKNQHYIVLNDAKEGVSRDMSRKGVNWYRENAHSNTAAKLFVHQIRKAS